MKEVVQRTYLDILICIIRTNLIVQISMFFLCLNIKAINLGMVGDKKTQIGDSCVKNMYQR